MPALTPPAPARAPGPAHGLAVRLRGLGLLKAAVVSVRRARTALIERYLSIDTCGPDGDECAVSTGFADAQGYQAIDYLLLRDYLSRVSMGPADVFYDVGCGEGRTLCLAARRPIARCVGIEVDPVLGAKARSNGDRLRGRKARIEVRLGDAAEADYSERTVYWLFNPFGARTL